MIPSLICSYPGVQKPVTFQLKETFYAGLRAISPAVIGSRETKTELTSWWYQKGSSWWEPDRQQGDRLLSVRCTGRGGQRDGGWTSQSGSTRTPIFTFKGRHLIFCRHLGKTTTQRRCLPEWQLNGAIINVIRGRQRSPWYDKGNAPEFMDDPEALNII